MTGGFLRGAVSVSGRAGTAAVEMAIVLPIVLTFMFGLTEFGRAIWTKATLDYAVQSAARCFAINDTTNCGSAAATKNYAATRALGLGLAGSDFTITTPACGKQVSASLTFNFAASGLFTFPIITLNSTACYPV